MQSATPLEHYQRADALLSSGDLQQAADICKQMLTESPNFAYGYHLMASLFRITGNLERALGFSELAIAIDPKVPEFFAQQGQLFLALGRFAEATTAFAHASHLEPSNVSYLVWQADACARQGQHELAKALFAQARAIGVSSEIDEHEGLTLLALGEMEAAEALFDRVIADKPRHASGYLHKAKSLLSRGRDHEAEICYAKALNCNPHHHEALHGLAVVNERQGQLDAAIALAIQAVNANGSIFDSLVLLGNLLLRKQNWASAEQIFQQALAVVPDNIYVLHGLMTAAAAQGKAGSVDAQIEAVAAAHGDNKALAFLSDAMHGKHRDAAPGEYITALFNDVALRYDYFLQPSNIYRAPMIAEVLASLPQLAGKTDLSLLDLGCGSGSAGEAFAAVTAVRVGVDLSARMLDKARMRKCYSDLYPLDITEFVMGSDRSFDILVAADVLPYIGNLEPFFHAARNVMSKESLFSFTLEKDDKVPAFTLNPNGRFAHAASYIRTLIEQQGYDIVVEEDVLLRFEMGSAVKGMFFVVKKMSVH